MIYLDNINYINFKKLLREIQTVEPAYVGPRLDKGDLNSNKIEKQWTNAGYQMLSNGGTVGWDMYFSGKQFNHDYIETICNNLGVKNLFSWISAIHPGNYAPWHYDTQPDESHLDRDSVERYHVHLEDWKTGHIFFVGNNALINYKQGDIYKWNSWREYHAGANAGYSIKYTLNMIVERI